jgi:hypothetical protein
MAKDKFDILGPLMNDIGRALAEIVGGDPNGVFLYVEIGDRWISYSIFKNEAEVVRYYDDDNSDLQSLLWDAWYAEPEGKNLRWSVLEYDVKDNRFNVSYKYPDEVDVEVVDEERREAALKARYGDKPVIYPPIPDGALELKP